MVHFKNNTLGVVLLFISHSTNEETKVHRDELANNKLWNLGKEMKKEYCQGG